MLTSLIAAAALAAALSLGITAPGNAAPSADATVTVDFNGSGPPG